MDPATLTFLASLASSAASTPATPPPKSGDLFSTPVFNTSGWNVNFRGTQVANASGGGASGGGGTAASSFMPAVLGAGAAIAVFFLLKMAR